MGNVCTGEQTEKLQLNKDSTAADKIQLAQNKKDKPKHSYAIMAGTPVLPEKILQTCEIVKGKKPIRDPLERGKKLPTYFIKDRNVYYDGEWLKGRPHGKGIALSTTGTYFEGGFRDGRATCKDGLLIYPDGSYYRGEIDDSKIDGTGEFVYAVNGLMYKGQWKDDKPEGEGEQFFKDGSYYRGSFVDGLKHGSKGLFRWANGKEYNGGFQNGYMEGQGLLTKGEGYFKGRFVRNLKSEGELVTANGRYQGPFVNGEMHGHGIFKYNDGKKYDGQFQSGYLHGRGRITYPNGQQAEGEWNYGENMVINDLKN